MLPVTSVTIGINSNPLAALGRRTRRTSTEQNDLQLGEARPLAFWRGACCGLGLDGDPDITNMGKSTHR